MAAWSSEEMMKWGRDKLEIRARLCGLEPEATVTKTELTAALMRRRDELISTTDATARHGKWGMAAAGARSAGAAFRTKHGIERKASAGISSEEGAEEAGRERKSAHTTGRGTPRPRQLVVTACTACSSRGYEPGDTVSAAPSPNGTGNRRDACCGMSSTCTHDPGHRPQRSAQLPET